MRKLDKTQIISSLYKKWLDDLEEKNIPHPKYNSSQNEFYLDIVMNLFNIQDGLCAYTEQLLCDNKFYDKENWDSGKYQNIRPEFNGQLEHFDESLKSKSNDIEGIKDWLWTNFFMVESDTNTKIKGKKQVEKDSSGKYILKPDEPEYNEFELLEYDIKTHRFRANRNQSHELKAKIDRMIDILGLNYGVISRKRQEKITKHHKLINFKEYTWDSIPFGEFVTAIKMYRNVIHS